ncbi:MAG: RNA polymerase sigma factor [Pseudomonadota bacterium]|nr:RNA polymerase sigma factor [Pseudomonadota bacterium]
MLESLPGQTTADLVVLADSEPMLIAQARQRNQQAFRRLYDKYLGKVYGLCLRMTGNRQMAEEATQEAFIQVWRKIDTFAGDSSFSTWLHSLTANTTISYLRKQKNWLQRMVGTDDYDVMAQQLPAGAATDEEHLQACLARLPERARIVFVLHAIEGYRQEEIATTLGIAVGTVKAQFHRARELMERWLGDGLVNEVNHE